VFAGLRPLPARGRPGSRTASLSRSHIVETSSAGLITITGGKWTTYRRMAEHAVNRAVHLIGRSTRSQTADLKLKVRPRAADVPASGRLHPALPYTLEDVRRAVWHEHARTVEDVLCRRTHAAFLNARAAMEMIEVTVGVIASELGRDSAWADAQRHSAAAAIGRFLPPTSR
jgi:glycerol-3-phosphate dehydrogenase